MEANLRDLGIPTDLHEFVKGPRHIDRSWESLLVDLVLCLGKITAELAENSLDYATLRTVLDEILDLPMEVCLPLDIANHNKLDLVSNLSQLKNISKKLAEFIVNDTQGECTISAIRCQMHLYTMASKVRLAIGSLTAVALLQILLKSVVHVLSFRTLSTEDTAEFRSVLPIPSISFEEMLIGELGFVYFSEDKGVDDENLESWKLAAAENPAMKSIYFRAKLRHRMPSLDSLCRQIYFNNMCNCIRDLRKQGDAFQIQDYRRHMSSKTPKALLTQFMLGSMNKKVFETAFLFGPNPGYVTRWLNETFDAQSTPGHSGTNINEPWGSIRVDQSGRESHLLVNSFFGRPLQLDVVPSQPAA